MAVVSVGNLAGRLVPLVPVLAESLAILRISQVRASISWKMKVLPVSFLAALLAGFNSFQTKTVLGCGLSICGDQ